MEIGSEFIIENTKSQFKNNESFFENKYGQVTFSSSGRGAISLVLNKIKPRRQSVLLPIYICESIISVFESFNYDIVYYDLNHDFSPKLNEWDEIGVFFHMGYFGFNTNTEIIKRINSMKKKSIVIIEDVTHSLFSSSEENTNSDYYICSLRKWFGIYSGGFMATPSDCEIEINDFNIQEDFVNLRKKSFQTKKLYFDKKSEYLKENYLSGFLRAEDMLDIDNTFYKIDDFSMEIIKNISLEEISIKRRNNYIYLMERLKDYPNFSIVFSELPKDITPLFFLVDAGSKRKKLQEYLGTQSIYCPIHWPKPIQITSELSMFESKDMYNNLLSIPCDQRYNLMDMRRIVEVISSWKG